MRLYNLQGELLRSVKTKSGNGPANVSVTLSGDLVYADSRDKSINLVRSTQIQTLITLRGLKPYNLCSTSSGDFLVIMRNDDLTQTKVVRYSGPTEKQTIQLDNRGKPLYSSGDGMKYLSENRNLDICVAEGGAGAVVVVNAAGKLRFRYTGPPFTVEESFDFSGIATDSRGNILVSDQYYFIHLIDEDGHFLCYIKNCGLQDPCSLCVDSKDNLFVAEIYVGKVRQSNI